MIKTSFEMYNKYLIKIMMISLMIVIPLSLFVYFSVYYLSDYLAADQYPHLYIMFLLIMNFICVVPVYRKLTKSEMDDEEEPTTIELVKEFFGHFGVILLVSLPLFMIAIYGIVLAFIPTIICSALILVFPFYVHELNFKSILNKTGSVLIRENILIVLDLMIIISAQILIYSLLMLAFSNFESNIYVYGIIQALVNAVVYPLLIFYLTQRYAIED